jgi:two-component SAPR family response regulator
MYNKILIVEDDEILPKIIKYYIEKQLGSDEEIKVTTNFKDTIQYLIKEKVDLIFMDVMLRGSQCNGLEISEAIRTLGITTPIIVLTCIDEFNLSKLKDEYKEYVSEFVTKPLTSYKLTYLLEKYKLKEDDVSTKSVNALSNNDLRTDIKKLEDRVRNRFNMINSAINNFKAQLINKN